MEFADPDNPSTKTDSLFYVSAEELFDREITTMTIGGNETYLLTSAEHNQLMNVNETQEEIVEALMTDLPYELFWFDKTQPHSLAMYGFQYYPLNEDVFGYAYAYTVRPYIEADFKVSRDYSVNNQVETNAFNLTRINAVKNTVNTVNGIVSTAQNNPQYNTNYLKLEFYKNRVCYLTDYDNGTTGRPYGDPWQLINVFDGDSSTKVVCEGYSKAFQFLCDKTNFSNNKLHVFTVTGVMTGGTGAGNHMWNIVQMPNGVNYMADITNSDSAMIGNNGTLFMSGAMAGGSVNSGYRYDCTGNNVSNVSYTYDTDTRNQYNDSDLVMSESAFDGNEEELSHDWAFKGFEWTKTANGYTAIANYECKNDSSHKDSINVTVTKQELAASCKKEGSITYTATVSTAASLDSSAHTDTKVETVEKVAHTPAEKVIENEEAASCENKGSYDEVVYCSICSEELTREKKTSEELGHDFGAWTVTNEPKCETTGTKTRVCKRNSDHVETETIPATGHTEVIIPAETPTCTTGGGKTEGKKCSVCNKMLAEPEDIDPLGHDFGAWSVVREATETQDGEEKSECSRCDAKETRAIPSGLKLAQANARAEIESINSSDFSGAEKEAVEKAKREAIDAINNAGSIAEVGNAVQTAKDIIAKQKTDKDKAEEEKKKQAEILDNEWNGILSGTVPAAKSVKAKAAKKSVKVSWKKATKKNLKKFDKVEIQVCPDRGFNRANTRRIEVKKSKKSATVKGLTKGMTYYVRVRDVKGSGTGKLVSKWSGVKKVKIKK